MRTIEELKAARDAAINAPDIVYWQCSTEEFKALYESGERDFQLCSLLGANRLDANLLGVNLSGADLTGAKLLGVNLSGADLSYANLSGANLSYANLSYANLSGADLTGASLSYANLSHANLSVTDLTGVNLSYANLSHANLRVTDLTGADLTGVKSIFAMGPGGSRGDMIYLVNHSVTAMVKTGCYWELLTAFIDRVNANNTTPSATRWYQTVVIPAFQAQVTFWNDATAPIE